MERIPGYRLLMEEGTLSARADALLGELASCCLCPRNCRVNRLAGEIGSCGVGESAWVSSFGPHHGEEDPLRGWRGSGTVFFSGCNLHCVYCQNADISQRLDGRPVDARDLADMMLELQRLGCHNINLVSPTHVAAQIAAAISLAAGRGLSIPVVYNSGGYDSLATLQKLEGLIDIYMPDMKYAREECGLWYSDIPDYPLRNREAVREMHRQVGDLQLGEDGIAVKGLLVRHLVLPEDLAGSGEVLRFIAEEISRNTYLNIMDQYRPAYRADAAPPLNRRVTTAEFASAIRLARQLGLSRLASG